MRSSEIRQRFLDFFRTRGHTVVPSDLLVPRDDPTLLFTSAGMTQFKEQFMGRNITYTRAASCQKCLRTGDLENVGKTPRHHTFFEMLGNFSFGDYFKKEAIEWGWEFMTKEMGLPKERLWVSVYEKDDEAYDIWLNAMKVPAEKIIKLGEHDNFWPADAPSKGPNGPCGPCSEIFYDWGEDTGCGKKTCSPACECGRFVEVWNLVFTQFERKPDGSLDPLPSKNIDTGMGLERMTAVMAGIEENEPKTNFETDLFVPLIDEVKKQLGGGEGKMTDADISLIADHIRAAAFCIADGVSPSNEKQGYVVRKLIRRAYLKSARKGPFLYNLVPKVAALMKDVYPELEEKREHVSAIIEEEEKRFDDTLKAAMPVMDDMLSAGAKGLDGEQIFKLVDTYGLPIDVIQEEAAGREISLDREGFEKLMGRRKEQSRAGSDMEGAFIFQPDQFLDAPRPEWSHALPLKGEIVFIVKGAGSVNELARGDIAEIIISPQSSVFYAEAGGQVGDAGIVTAAGGTMDILNTFGSDGRKIHQVRVTGGKFASGDIVEIDLDARKKSRTAMNHTATHLAQAALRSVLGDHVKQSGSMVDHRRLRFDFTHMKKLSDRELARVEGMVNGWIADGIEVCKEEKALTEAKEEGALSFFGEKYADTVRVVTVGETSKELCGGTHVDNTRKIGLFKITAESSVASGIRRIEAVTGDGVEFWIREDLKHLLAEIGERSPDPAALQEDILSRAQNIVDGRVRVDRDLVMDLEGRLRPALLEMKEKLEKAAKKIQKEKQVEAFNELKIKMDDAAEVPESVNGIDLVSCLFPGAGMQVLRKAAYYLEKRAPSSVVLLGGGGDDKAYLVCAVPRALADKGISAKKIVNSIAGRINGSGGGKETFAQAGGSDPEGLGSALEEAKHILEGKG